MPTPISHAAVGFAVAAWTQRGAPSRRVCAVAAACAVLPDIDVLGCSKGVEFLAPFSEQRFRSPWTPLGEPRGGVAGQFVQDAAWVLAPAILVGWLGLANRRGPRPERPR